MCGVSTDRSESAPEVRSAPERCSTEALEGSHHRPDSPKACEAGRYDTTTAEQHNRDLHLFDITSLARSAGFPRPSEESSGNERYTGVRIHGVRQCGVLRDKPSTSSERKDVWARQRTMRLASSGRRSDCAIGWVSVPEGRKAHAAPRIRSR